MTRKLIARMAAGAALTFATIASPVSLEAQSRLNFEGSAKFSSGPAGSNLLIDFLSAGQVAGPPSGTVNAIETISGAFDPEITPGETGIIQDLQFVGGQPVGLPIVSFLAIDSYNFTLGSVAGGGNFGPVSIFQLPNSSSTLLAFAVMGTVVGPDFIPPRNYQGVFTAQFAGQTPAEVQAAITRAGGTDPVSFSAEFIVADAQVVPEPATVMLLGTGIAGLGLFGLRRRNATQA